MGTFDYELGDMLEPASQGLRRAIRKVDGQRVLLKSAVNEAASREALWQLEYEYSLLQKLDSAAVARPLALERDPAAVSALLVLQDFGGVSPTVPTRGLELELFFRVALSAARALGQLHDRRVIHKNLCPGSLLFNSETGELKLVGFQYATELSSERQEPTALSRMQGSLSYISPEQTGRVNRELDYRSDYYSLGVTLFELCTGKLPFVADDAMGYVHAHLSKRAPLCSSLRPEVPAMLSALIGKLLAKDPDERYQSSRGIVSDLERCEQQWRAGSQAAFSLGTEDARAHFAVPQTLFGRGEESAELLEVFESAVGGQSKLLLLSGPSGIGKTSLLHELQRPVSRASGYWVAGKFDQLDQNVPYAALLQAMQALVKHVLYESDARVAELGRALGDALGPNAQVLVELVPELTQIIGPQPAVAQLGPAETQHRFRRVVREFLRVFARPQHPLVIVIDDLQWMDASTPDLLVSLFLEGDIQHLLLIGAYRDNEVKGEHPLTRCVRALAERRSGALHELRLAPLPASAVAELVAETLRAQRGETAAIAQLLHERTEGNPFFVTELLASLHRAGVFTFQRDQGRWSYDLERVRQAATSESIAELMVQRLEKLSVAALRALTAAACVGAQFELGVLAEVMGARPSEVAEALWEALVQRVIVPLDGQYRMLQAEGADVGDGRGARFQFQHERVHRAAYGLLEAETRTRMHLALGRALARLSPDEVDVFDVAHHLDLGAALLEPQEREQLSDVCAQAGEKAERSAAYAIAAQHLSRAIEHGESSGRVEAHRLFELHRRHVRCVFLGGEVERAALACEELFPLAPSAVAKGAAYALKTQILEYRGRLLDAVSTIREGLRSLGVELPEAPGDIERGIADGIAKMQGHLSRVSVEGLARLPHLQDAERVMTLDLLFQVIPPAIQTYPPLFVLAELMMFDLAVCHGVTDKSCKNFVDCGIIQGGLLGDYDVAYRLGLSAFELLQRYRPTPLESSVHFVFAAFVSQFKRPFREGFDSYTRAARVGLELGDVQHVAYATVHRSHRSLLVGANLSDCEREAREALTLLEGARASGQLLGMLVTTWSLARLRGTDTMQPSGGRTENEVVQTLRDAGNAQWLFSFGQAQTLVSLLLGDLSDARRWLAFTEPFEPAGVSLFSQPDHHLARALLALDSAAPGSALTPQLEKDRALLARWAEACPENFAHKHWLVSAELARVEGQPMAEVLGLYDAAIASTGGDFCHLAALAGELRARYLASIGQRDLSGLSLERAYRAYEAWGASAKLSRLARERPELASRVAADAERSRLAPVAPTGLDFDLTSVLKATRAISSEVRPERLFRALMEAIIENAGAELGCLIVKDDSDGAYRAEAWAAVDPGLAATLRSAPLDRAERVCADVVRYVLRTHQSVVLDDAASSGELANDDYIRRHAVRSLLCVPVLNQGVLIAVLYAENNATSYAFTKARVEVLSMLASQAAISITNALLYEQLEHKVQQRTRELAEQHREMEAMLHNMDQGIFTIDPKLTIQPNYSRPLERILDASGLSGQAFMPLLFRGSKLRADQLAATETALRFSFETPSELAGANLGHAVRSFEAMGADGQSRFFEVDWNAISDDEGRVTKILVAVRDVTVVRQLIELAARRERETDIVAQLLDSGLEGFRGFAASARRLLDDCRRLTAQGVDAEGLRALFRNVHTIKGNARLFGYSHVVDVAHQVEEVYSELRSGVAGHVLPAALETDLDAVARCVGEYEQVCEQKLKPLAGTRDARLERAVSEIDEVLAAPGASSRPGQVLAEVSASLRRWRAVPLAELVREVSRMLPSLASEVGRAAPFVDCRDGDALLDRHSAEVVRAVLVQAWRNSLAHGLEPGEQRAARSKSAQGRLRVSAELRPAGLVVRLSDDGRGLALEELRRQTNRSGLSDEELAELAFEPGVSTAEVVSRSSGRGVGMDLIRASVRQLGGDARLAFTAAGADGYRDFELVLSLPAAASVS
jgi:predicted ATPase/HPt (histidine-containing phosphotransfer) domain-containing protein